MSIFTPFIYNNFNRVFQHSFLSYSTTREKCYLP
jgi:hypothetical protein